MSENRIIKLELLFAEQEHAIAEMSDEMARQGREIDMLTKRLESLALRFSSLEEASQPDIPVTKPPHW